jgi:hypothetical protein
MIRCFDDEYVKSYKKSIFGYSSHVNNFAPSADSY